MRLYKPTEVNIILDFKIYNNITMKTVLYNLAFNNFISSFLLQPIHKRKMFYGETHFNKNKISEYKHIRKTKIHN